MDDHDKDILLAKLDWDWFGHYILKSVRHNGYYISALCPYHDDRHASLSVIKEHGGFRCHACGKTGDFIDLICDSLGIEFKEAIKLISGNDYQYKTYKKQNEQKHETKVQKLTWTTQQVQDKHIDLLSNDAYCKAVYNYGISLDIVKKAKLGILEDYDCLRLVIPIGKESELVSVKLHRITGKPKVKSFSAPGSIVFVYPYKSIMQSNKLLLVEGEPDTLCGMSNNVESLGITPCCFTGGAMTFKMEWLPFFINKTVYISYDSDSPGISGTEKLLSYLDGRAIVYIVKLSHGVKDLRDYFTGGHTLEQLKEDIKDARLYDRYHPIYIKKRLYPILEEVCNDRFKWSGLRQEIDRLFAL